MEPEQFQRRFFERIQEHAPNEWSVETIGRVLNVNKSSVYNRLNGAQLLRLDELKALADYFQIPLQTLVPKPTEQVVFTLPTLVQSIDSGEAYLRRIHDSLRILASAPDMRIWYSTSELPFFQYMNFRELGLFKIFAWGRINWRLPYLEDSVFHPDTFEEGHVYESLMLPILKLYNQVATVEFWTPGIYENTLAQLRYFEASGQMAEGVAAQIREQMRALARHQYAMAERGRKWSITDQPSDSDGTYELFLNEISPTNIAFLTESKQIRRVFTVFDNPNFMSSDDPNLYTYTQEWMTKLRQKCTQISLTAEQDRRKFFQRLHRALDG